MKYLLLLCLCVLLIAPLQAKQPPSIWFNTLVANWPDYAKPEFLQFLHDAKPEVAQVGFYRLSYYSFVPNAMIKGYMTSMPVEGFAETQQWLRDYNNKLHQEHINTLPITCCTNCREYFCCLQV